MMAERGEVAPGDTKMVSSFLQVLYNYLLAGFLWVLEKLLLTDVSLQKQLNLLDEEAEHIERAESQTGHTPLLEVTEMKEKKLTINIKAAPLDHNEDDDYDPPSSADIEVVHKKAPPKLHSILKQRTLSESSDDHGCSGGESPRSGQEDSPGLDGGKKSVSFNSHIDSTTYKKNTAPTSMKTALKSKRRRARKKEEKKANTRRRRNSGSEGSSGEELSQTDSVSTSDDKDENEDENDDAHFDQIAEDDEGEIELAEGKSGGLIVGSGEGSVKAGKDNQDFRTSAFNEGSVSDKSDKKKKMVQEIKTKLATAENPQAADSDDDDFDNPAELDERTSTDSASCVNDVHEENVNQALCDEVNEMSQKSESGPTSKTEGSDNIVSASTISRPGDLQRVMETQDSSVIKIRAENKADGSEQSEPPLIEELEESDKGDNSSNQDKVESMLSWKDKGEVLDPFSNGHKTQCAFSFSNSVIYDLDVD